MKNLTKKLKTLLNEDIIDIFIFGSKIKGKTNYSDIDLAVLLKKEDKDIKEKIKRLVPNSDVQILYIEDIYEKIFLTIIKEGYSIKNNDYMHNLYGLKPVKIYKYSLNQLTPSKKVMFERGIKTIPNITKLSNSVIMVEIKNTGEFEEFLKLWDMDIDTKDYELIPMMRKEIF